MYKRGFTIVELLIVVVIIGILAAIVIFVYTGLQTRAVVAKVQADEKEIIKAIIVARENTGETLLNITGTSWTADNCYSQPTGTDLAELDQSDACWTSYNGALDAISDASGINIRAMKDYWGRPYYIDENEGEDPLNPCQEDIIATYSYPFENYGASEDVQFVPLSLPASSC